MAAGGGQGGPVDFDETIETMTATARRIDVGKIEKDDIGRIGRGSGRFLQAD